jgi:hypothetical protein
MIGTSIADAGLGSSIGRGRAGAWRASSTAALAFAVCVIATSADAEVFAVAREWRLVIIADAAAEAE